MRSVGSWPDAARGVMGLIALTLLVPWVARAQGSSEVRTYLSSISRLYDKLEYERALEQIASAKRLTRGLEEDVALTLYEGIVLADMGKTDKASAAFQAALFLKPEAKLPVQVSPKVERLFEKLREQVDPKPAPPPTEQASEPRRPGPDEPGVLRAPEIVEAYKPERSTKVPQALVLRIVARDARDKAIRFSWETNLGTLEPPTSTATTSEVLWKARTCAPEGVTPTVKATVTNSQGLSTSMNLPVFAAPCIVHAAGDRHSLRLRPDGTVWAWGSNTHGQLGDGSTTHRSAPVRVSALRGVVAVSAGGSHSLAVLPDGTVGAWGNNSSKQLGNGSTTHRTTPGRVLDLRGVVAVSAGGSHSLAVREDGTVWAWGNNRSGQLGDGTTVHRSMPVQVKALSGVVAVSAGMHHSLAVREDGTVWAWGNNDSGQLGDGTITNRSTPVQVSGLSGVAAVSAGYFHSLAARADGTVWAWGNNGSGQLGEGTTTHRSTPVQVSGLSGVAAVSAGHFHSLATREDGTVWAWGSNQSGQLGDGTTANRSSPVQVGGLSGVAAVSAGMQHSLSLRKDGTVWAWGSNASEQRGDGTAANRSSPVQVSH